MKMNYLKAQSRRKTSMKSRCKVDEISMGEKQTGIPVPHSSAAQFRNKDGMKICTKAQRAALTRSNSIASGRPGHETSCEMSEFEH